MCWLVVSGLWLWLLVVEVMRTYCGLTAVCTGNSHRNWARGIAFPSPVQAVGAMAVTNLLSASESGGIISLPPDAT